MAVQTPAADHRFQREYHAMRTYGRDANGKWVLVVPDENGFNDSIYLTTLIQNLKLAPQESPFLQTTASRLRAQSFSRCCLPTMSTGFNGNLASISHRCRSPW
jgi:hypothetical protein